MSGLPANLREALARAVRRAVAPRPRRRAQQRFQKPIASGGGSKPIADARDALAYALARMPATYAAVSACLPALREARPDFAPVS